MPTFDGVEYTDRGAYAALDFETLVAQYGGGYQGSAAVPFPDGSVLTQAPGNFTGYRLGKVGKRWVFVAPDGKVMLKRGIYRATYAGVHKLGWAYFPDATGGYPAGSGAFPRQVQFTQQANRVLQDVVNVKYAGSGVSWQGNTANRFKAWHFNSTGSDSIWLAGFGGIAPDLQLSTGFYSLNGMWFGTFGTPQASRVMPVPGVTEPVKDVLRYAVRQDLPGQDGWSGRHQIDMFDPKFKLVIDWLDPSSNASTGSVTPNNGVLYYQSEDGDYAFCFSSGVGNETGVTRNDSFVPHLGMVALIGRPTIVGPHTDPRGNVWTWSADTVNHLKAELVAYLQTIYPTITALNAAWGSSYTTFGSDGAWGVGNGLLDEDGFRPRRWLGRDGPAHYAKIAGQNDYFDSTVWGPDGATVTHDFPAGLSAATGTCKAMRNDLDNFLFLAAKQYFKTIADRLQIRDPGALYIGHTGVGHRGCMSRRPVWAAMGQTLHLMRAGQFDGDPNNPQINRQLREWTGDIPWVSAIYYPNNDDGCMYFVARGDGTQAARGQGIATILTEQTAYKVPEGTPGDGSYMVVGNNFWDLYDMPNEHAGWGLASYNDNPYDGGDHRTAHAETLLSDGVVTLTGRTVVPEDRIYGDLITPIKNANLGMYQTLLTQFDGGTPPPPGEIMAILNVAITNQDQEHQVNYNGVRVRFQRSTDGGVTFVDVQSAIRPLGATSDSYNVLVGQSGHYRAGAALTDGTVVGPEIFSNIFQLAVFVVSTPQTITLSIG